MIPAYLPQARRRSECNFGTWQGRLPQELRLAGIGSVEAAIGFCRSITSPRSVQKLECQFAVATCETNSGCDPQQSHTEP
jgi:hypothetical protein